MYTVKYHNMNRAALIERIEEARNVLEKLLTSLNRRPSSATDSLLTFTSPAENIDERTKLPESPASKSSVCHRKLPDRREHGLQRRVWPMGTFASGWRLIGATVAHLRLKRSEWTLLVFEKTSPCYPNLDSRYRETGQHLFTGCISLIFRRSGSQG
jgi:hypothetical protein